MRHKGKYALAGCCVIVAAVTIGIVLQRSEPRAPDSVAPGRQAPAFVDEGQCADCHGAEASAWRRSHHDLAMQAADGSTVLGDFADAVFSGSGSRTRFFQRNGKYWINTTGENGRPADFEVKYTFGVEPLQQYLVALDRGRLQAFTIAWDVQGKRWFDLYPHERIDHDDELHWTKPSQNWNFMCAECHSSGLRKNYDPATRTYNTTWKQIDVGCQACHGPASSHVARMRNTAASAEANGFSTDPMISGQTAQVEACARCHSRRAVLWGDYRHGKPLMDTHLPALLTEDLYYADGQIKGEVYEYGSFLQSKMHRQGLRCSDCHEPHSLSLRREGNALCTGCHNSSAAAARPGIDTSGLRRKDYDSPQHHFHKRSGRGSQCVDCHAPTRTYMEIDPRHDHSFRIPRPDLSVKLQTPNACNSCHGQRSAQWAADWAAKWYGPQRRQEATFAQTLDAARRRQAGASAGLLALALDSREPAIVRASAFELLGEYPGPQSSPALQAAVEDPDPLVRLAAVNALEAHAPVHGSLVQQLATDPVRAVRIGATAVIAALPGSGPAAAGIAEYEASQLENADQPSSHMNLGNLYASLGQAGKAQAAYHAAIRLDPSFTPAYVNLADLNSRTGENGAAIGVLQVAIESAPDDAALHHTLGLALIRERRYVEAVAELAEAARLDPSNARFAYVLGVALHDTGEGRKGIAVLEKALGRNPDDRDLLSALAAYATQVGDQAGALKYAQRLRRIESPDEPSSAP